METTEKPSQGANDLLHGNATLPPTPEQLAAFVASRETEENMQKLAGKLAEEWNEEMDITHKPDLSYARFEERRRSAGDQ
ncbi:hypothetical protein [Dyadobacter sp. Leaf189]|uniref:hypothetical protein n=1 Tax=Dyadobacter sp. Leaf189 TaxID=1736295 RepID=UPI0006F56DE8|nr:hypothetical protein [Dyadobacter sp. Leaf189]KQS34120.1 hypothetical protein ASG33_08900 [Dyadobacter sp. Leaf189]